MKATSVLLVSLFSSVALACSEVVTARVAECGHSAGRATVRGPWIMVDILSKGYISDSLWITDWECSGDGAFCAQVINWDGIKPKQIKFMINGRTQWTEPVNVDDANLGNGVCPFGWSELSHSMYQFCGDA